MNATQYLEAAKIEEIASQYEREGYEVQVAPRENFGYDLVASKGERRLAIEVKARSILRESADQIKRLREQAIQQGFDEFRLVVVNPPREVSVEITGLEAKLLQYVAENLPNSLEQLSSSTRVENVVDVDIDSIEVTIHGIRVSGSATVEVELNYGDDSDGLTLDTSFPLLFEVELDHSLHIARVHELTVDTSSYYE